jgi:hypothetical protein
VEQELAAVTALRPRATVELADDNTFAGRGDHADLLSALERSGVRYFTECDWRVGERPEVLARLAASGCVQVLVGVETLSPRHEGMGAKAAPLGRVVEALMRVQEAGVAVIGCFVVGGDGEDLESMHALGEFLIACPLADVQLTLQTPFPGTALRARLEREGRLLPGRGWESCTLFDVAYRPDRLGLRARHVVWVVLLFSDGLLLLALMFAPLPVIDFMGGLQQSPQERELASMAVTAGMVGCAGAPVLLVGTVVAAERMRAAGGVPAPGTVGVPRGAMTLAGAALAFWIAALVVVRPEQRNRYEAETRLRSGDVAGALAVMSAHGREDYPPVWDPPPRPSWRIYEPPAAAVRAALVERPPAAWVGEMMWAKCWRDLAVTSNRGWWFDEPAGMASIPVQSLPPRWEVGAAQHAEHDPRLGDEQRAALRELIGRVEEYRRGEGFERGGPVIPQRSPPPR